MDQRFILFILIFSFSYCTGQGRRYIGNINCQSTVMNVGCNATECIVSCPEDCNKRSEGQSPMIWGTKVYTCQSRICRSAVHDFRISPDSSTTNVTYRKSNYERNKFLPSIQQGIISNAAFEKSSCHFSFSTPYITEDVLDVSTLNFKYLYEQYGPFIQSCQISDKGQEILDFQFYIPSPARRKPQKSSGWKEMAWSHGSLQPGGYWCNVVNNSYSNVMSLAMASDADFEPEQWTLTASSTENVEIKFIQRNKEPGSTAITWKKDQQTLPNVAHYRLSRSNYEYSLQISNVDVGDSGIYSLEFSEQNKHLKRGVMRLIVRRCPKTFYGTKCDQKCPNCINGGVCHDIMGICICPPGFNGTQCERTCETSYFGQRCSQSCGTSQHAIDSSCKGALICLPDPYGCSCTDGYTGLACDQNGPTTASAVSTSTTTLTTSSTSPTITDVTTITSNTISTITTPNPTVISDMTSSTSPTAVTRHIPSSTTTHPTTIGTTSASTDTELTSTSDSDIPITNTNTDSTTIVSTTTQPTTITNTIPDETSTTTLPTSIHTTTLPTSIPTTTTTIPDKTTTTTLPTSIPTTTTTLPTSIPTTTTPIPDKTTTTTTTLPTSIPTTTTTTTLPTSIPTTTTTIPDKTTTTTTLPTSIPDTTTTGPSTTMSLQGRMCENVLNGGVFKVEQIRGNSCKYLCTDSVGKTVVPVIKTDGESCKNGICVKGVCRETLTVSGCPENFNGVEKICKVYCYSGGNYPGTLTVINAKDGEICIDKDYHGTCIGGKCMIIQGRQK